MPEQIVLNVLEWIASIFGGIFVIAAIGLTITYLVLLIPATISAVKYYIKDQRWYLSSRGEELLKFLATNRIITDEYSDINTALHEVRQTMTKGYWAVLGYCLGIYLLQIFAIFVVLLVSMLISGLLWALFCALYPLSLYLLITAVVLTAVIGLGYLALRLARYFDRIKRHTTTATNR